ncbi:MAG: hypothetical protein CL534_23880 [Ahrensia sp.]|jgi:hypothetical protein|nr:hypothetical protein [Ahrensia sp.]
MRRVDNFPNAEAGPEQTYDHSEIKLARTSVGSFKRYRKAFAEPVMPWTLRQGWAGFLSVAAIAPAVVGFPLLLKEDILQKAPR